MDKCAEYISKMVKDLLNNVSVKFTEQKSESDLVTVRGNKVKEKKDFHKR